MNQTQKRFKKKVSLTLVLLMAFMLVFSVIGTTSVFAAEETHETVAKTADEASVAMFGLIAAAVAFGFGAIGAGIAIANVGAAAMGTIGEKPEIAGQALIFIALAEGLVVFGFITALMILGKI